MLNYRDISPTNGIDLDEKCAADHFFGLTIDQSYEIFVEHPEYYLNDFLYMGDKGFGHYLPIIAKHILNNPKFWIEQHPQLELLLEIIKQRRNVIIKYNIEHLISSSLSEIMKLVPRNYILSKKLHGILSEICR